MAGEIELDRLPPMVRESKKMKFFLTHDKVEVYFKKDQCSICINSRGKQVTIIDRNGNQRVYPIEKLPECHWKKYTVATKFVDLVRSKTPKITLYSAENDDFKNLDDSGNKLAILKAILMENKDFEVTVKDEFNDSIQKIKVNKMNFPESPNLFEAKLEALYQLSLSVERSLSSLEKLTKIRTFPASIGSRTLSAKRGADQASAIHPSTVASSRLGKSVIVPGVGMASQSPGGTVTLNFEDGSAIAVSPDSRITYSSKRGVTERYNREDVLPKRAMEKLKHIPSAVERLRRKSYSVI